MSETPRLPPLPPLPPESRSSRSTARWVVLGCVGFALAVTTLGVIVAGGAMRMMRGEAYEQALQQLRRHPAAVEALGESPSRRAGS